MIIWNKFKWKQHCLLIIRTQKKCKRTLVNLTNMKCVDCSNQTWEDANHAFITVTCHKCITFSSMPTSFNLICEYRTEDECETTLWSCFWYYLLTDLRISDLWIKALMLLVHFDPHYYSSWKKLFPHRSILFIILMKGRLCFMQ